jgi:hypothetical protein
MLFVDVRFLEWKIKHGVPAARALAAVYPHNPLGDHNARQGIIDIDGVATKHYLLEELHTTMASHGLDVLETAKIEYPWDSEFDSPPSWMQAPFPWDWFVMARRKK